MNVLFVVLGVALLYYGGELLVNNAVRLAGRLKISSLVIGLTVVAFGTSAPELAATLAANVQGLPELALGNVVGSNIANVGLILGLTALLYPLQSGPTFVRRELPVMVGVSALLVPLLWDGVVGRVEGALLLLLLGGYLFYLLKLEPDSVQVDTPDQSPDGALDETPLWRSLLFIALGVGLLVGGARLLVIGAAAIARAFGVPEAVIGLTLVAFGTSLPELASSVVAALRKETDIIWGNIVGSNIFNVLAVVGVTALVTPVREPFGNVAPDLGVMLAFGVALLPLMFIRNRLGRVGGGALLLAYLGYVAYLFV
ncbi:calcium/sodium antiporter [soil metagenome]